ncbi:MAG TPA: hypothetical protein VFZ78_00900 [Flavisolibacter sp.]
MKRTSYLLLLLLPLFSAAQKKGREISFAVNNNHTAYPFGSFSRLFSGPLHPGAEAGYSFSWKEKGKYTLFQNFRAGYFYHRFVQHAIPVYTQFGYRYRVLPQLDAQAMIGAGYLHSVPATAVLKLNDNGEYENAKGIGRGQVLFNAGLSLRFRLQDNVSTPSIFLQYSQQLQAPFINSYVPLLPYNTMAIGASLPLKK